jgi:hypothetical protein
VSSVPTYHIDEVLFSSLLFSSLLFLCVPLLARCLLLSSEAAVSRLRCLSGSVRERDRERERCRMKDQGMAAHGQAGF